MAECPMDVAEGHGSSLKAIAPVPTTTTDWTLTDSRASMVGVAISLVLRDSQAASERATYVFVPFVSLNPSTQASPLLCWSV